MAIHVFRRGPWEDDGKPECPVCLGGEGDLCSACEADGFALCESCDEWHKGMVPATLACGCVDDVPLCAECRESQASEECAAHFKARRQLAGIDYPAHLGKGGGWA